MITFKQNLETIQNSSKLPLELPQGVLRVMRKAKPDGIKQHIITVPDCQPFIVHLFLIHLDQPHLFMSVSQRTLTTYL